MPSSSSPLRRALFICVIVVLSGAVWLACWQISHALLNLTEVKTGITLVYVPAGVRLVILLISGLAGAAGIALVFPFALLQEFPDLGWQEVLVYSAIAGLVPYGTILAICRAAQVSRDLTSLRSIHLPLLAAAVSVAGAIAYTAALVAFGRFDSRTFLPDLLAMAAGDFLGCFAVVVIVRLVVAGSKRWK